MKLVFVLIVALFPPLCMGQGSAKPLPTFPLPAEGSRRGGEKTPALHPGVHVLPGAIWGRGDQNRRVGINTKTHSEECGATGNCPMSATLKYQGRLRTYSLDIGWTYAVVRGSGQIPDIVTMSNYSAYGGTASLYRFVGGRYVLAGCDDVELREEGPDARYILNPSDVVIRSCPNRE